MSELAEGARLEIVCAAYTGTEGSNPSLSAISYPRVHPIEHQIYNHAIMDELIYIRHAAFAY